MAIRGSVKVGYLVVLLGAAAQLVRFSADHFFVDDAWISFRVARNLLEHRVPTYDVTLAPVEGMTNLLWTLLSTTWIAALPDLDPIVPARIVGATLFLLTVLLAARLAGRMAQGAGGSVDVAGITSAALVAVSGSLAYYAMSGLETPLWGFLFVASMERVDRALRGARGAWFHAGALLALLAACRPEGVLIGIVVCGWLVLHRHSRRHAWRAAVPFLFGVALMELFRLGTYGALVPNTFHAKPPYPVSGLRYLSAFWLMGTGALGLAAVGPAVKRVSTARLMACVLVVGAAGTVWSGGDWMPGYRRFTLPFLCIAVLGGAGLSLARGRLRSLVIAAVACVVVGNLAGAFARRDSAGFNTFVLSDLGRLAEETPGVNTVALTDIGRFGWHFRGSVFDLVGLTDAHIARQPGVHGKKSWDEDYFRRRGPDLVLAQNDRPLDDAVVVQFRTRSSEIDMLDSIMTHGGYEYVDAVGIGTDLYLLIFRRVDLELPPRLWGSSAPTARP